MMQSLIEEEASNLYLLVDKKARIYLGIFYPLSDCKGIANVTEM